MIAAAGSLRLRLLLGGSVLIVLAVAVAGIALSALFGAHVLAQFDAAQTAELDGLAAALRLAPDGQVALRMEPADPRFRQPYGGRYWQITTDEPSLLRSRSLWDRTLPLENDVLTPGALHRHEVVVAGVGALRVAERLVRLSEQPDRPIRIAVGMPVAEIRAVLARFDRLLVATLVALALGLVAASWVQVTVGLSPLSGLGRALVRVRVGEALRLEGRWPDEVAGLVEELNALLAEQERSLARARAQAGDLAHGLKTSLQLLLLDADRLTRENSEQRTTIREQVTRMQRIIDHHLGRARAQPRGRRPAPIVLVAPSIEALVQVLGPAAAARSVEVQTVVSPGAGFAGDREDLEEILGNLLDNACKWARSQVRVEVKLDGDRLVVAIEDDGPGLDEASAELAFGRGRRLDERTPGSGLGLAIAREITETIGGTIQLARSPLGGLAAMVHLPGGHLDGGAPIGPGRAALMQRSSQ